jgi:hypothetical protein
MADTALKQTTIRVDPQVLLKARFVLNAQNKSVTEYLAEQLESLATEYDKQIQDRERRKSVRA